MSETRPTHSAGPDDAKRRDFLLISAATFAAVGTAAAVWPFLDQMNPDANTLALGEPVTVDLSPIQPGQQIVVQWRGRPIFIVHRTPEELKRLQEPSLLERLRDPNSKVYQQGAYAANWHRSIKPEYLVLVGICTHLGCIPEFRPQAGEGPTGGHWPGGYFCPCHGSLYDLSGRVFDGVPAPDNLPVPPYTYVSDTSISIGENPKGSSFNFADIDQI